MKSSLKKLLFAFFVSQCALPIFPEHIWQKIKLDQLTTSDVFVMVDLNTGRALQYVDKANPPAIEVTLNSDRTQITSNVSDNIKWQLGKSGNNYYFVPITAKGCRLINIEGSTNVRITPNYGELSTFTHHESGNYIGLQNTHTKRYLGVYNKQDWRCYESTTNTIANTHIAYYKYTENIEKIPTIVTIVNDRDTQQIESYIGASYSLPKDVAIVDGLEFIGWSKKPIVAGTTVTTKDILPPGRTIIVEEGATFYAVYANPTEVEEPTYIRIEEELNDWTGTYLIVFEKEGKAFNGNLGKNELFNKSISNAVDITITDKRIKVDTTNEQYEFFIEKFEDGYSVKSKSGIYIGFDVINTAGKTGERYKFNITLGNRTCSPIRTTSYYLHYHESKSQFAVTMNSHTPLQLYKRAESTKSYSYYTTALSNEIIINKYGYATWYSGMPVSVPDGLKAYYCSIDGNTAILNDIGSFIPANTGAILYSDNAVGKEHGESYLIPYTNKQTTDFSENALIGYVQDTEVDNNHAHYALNVCDEVIGFYIPQTTTENNPTPTSPFIARAGKAYLELPPSSTINSYAIRRIDNTSIGAIPLTLEKGILIYDLMGRKLKRPNKGIYIINGHKVAL